MKMFSVYLTSFLMVNQGFCADSNQQAEPRHDSHLAMLKNNPGVSLNCQDVPMFYTGNPLEELNAFTVIPPLFENNSGMEIKLEKAIEKELNSVGEVVHLKELDTRGFGSGNMLIIQVKNVMGWNGKEMAISRVSLQVQTSVVVSRTELKTFPAVWSINAFFQGLADSKSEDQMLKATQKLVDEFVQNYKYANQEQKKKPIFYIYD